MSIAVQIADAVVSTLESVQFPAQPIFSRDWHYMPKRDALVDIRVTVTPRTLVTDILSRDKDTWQCDVELVLQTRVANLPQDGDALVETIEKIVQLLHQKPLEGFPEAFCIKVSADPLFVAGEIHDLRAFISVITATFVVPVPHV